MPAQRPARGASAHVVVGGLLLAAASAGCGSSTPAAWEHPSETALPTELIAFVDQSRVERVGRTVFVRLVHDGESSITVTRAEIASERFDEVVWTGNKSFTNEADLEFELPTGACGTGSDADVRLTYRIDDGPELVSTTVATDRYGAIALFLDRDCAAQVMGEAAEVTIGAHRVVGQGRKSVYELTVTFAPTGARDDVTFDGFGGTVLFSTAPGTPVFPESPVTPLVDSTYETVLRLIPGRCDPHALAEDKVGTLVYVYVSADRLPSGSAYYLPISDDARGDLRSFFGSHCGLT
ncbi:MAG: hypothetical protein WB767_14755 [Nocardioides sp.]